MIKSGGRSDFGIRQSPARSSECPSELLRLQEAGRERIVSQSTAVMANAAVSSSSRSWLWFAIRGLAGGLILGGVCAGTEYMTRGKNLRDVALPTYLLVYPLVGLGLSRLGLPIFGCVGLGASLRFLFGRAVAA